MRLNIIAWDISQKKPELISDYWQPMTMLKECIKELKERAVKQPCTRALIIDWATREIIVELKGEKIYKYKPIEICISAAIRMKDGYIIKGHRHADCIETMKRIPKYKKEWAFGENQGFITSANRYVSRIEGAKLQKAAGIKSIMPEGQEFLHGELYSEDLY
jgi:hypothetical protein